MNDRFTRWRKSSRSGASGGCVEVAAGWRKSSYSEANANCVEVADSWRKSTRSGSSQSCVEVSAGQRIIGVRDTKQHGGGTVLDFSADAWRAFLTSAKSGRFDCER